MKKIVSNKIYLTKLENLKYFLVPNLFFLSFEIFFISKNYSCRIQWIWQKLWPQRYKKSKNIILILLMNVDSSYHELNAFIYQRKNSSFLIFCSNSSDSIFFFTKAYMQRKKRENESSDGNVDILHDGSRQHTTIGCSKKWRIYWQRQSLLTGKSRCFVYYLGSSAIIKRNNELTWRQSENPPTLQFRKSQQSRVDYIAR